MAEVYDTICAYQLNTGDFALIAGKEVIVTDVNDDGDSVFVHGNCLSESDSEFEAELDPFLEINLLTE